ncbi:MAG: hypothetical protein Q9209_002003 [Squamulea sp. 1 TL-2023]
MSKPSAIAQEAYVCLRCRSRLPRFNTKAYATSGKRAKKSQRRGFSTRTRSLQHSATVKENGFEDPDILESGFAQRKSTNQEHDNIKLPSDCRVEAKSPYAFKRAHLYSKDDLGVTTLGKPAEVLRLRDLPDRHKASKWWLKSGPDNKRLGSTEPLTASDILKRVISERGLVSSARASHNIEQLKQDWLSSLDDQDQGPTESECYELGRQLYDGFTTKQLLGYLGESRIPRFRDVLDLDGPYRSLTFTRSEWRLGTTPFPGDASQQLHSMAQEEKEQHTTPAHSASTLLAESRRSGDPYKQVQVNEIMQKCWYIKPRGELDMIGEVDILIPEAHLDLLVSHKRNMLQQLAGEYEAKIEFSKPDGIIRLTANQAVCTSSLKLLLMVLDEVTCHQMDLKDKGSPEPDAQVHQLSVTDDALREIERLSNTVIRRFRRKHSAFPDPDKLLIYSLNNDMKSVDDAQNFIRQLCRPSRSSVTGIFYGGRPVKSMKPNLLPIVGTGSLPLTERGTEWTRISTANNMQGTRAQAEFYPSKVLNSIEHQLQDPAGVAEANKHSPSHPHWEPNPFQESSVVLGRVLYPAETMALIKRERYFLDALNKGHVFDTNVPSLTRALDVHSTRTVLAEDLRVRLEATTTTDIDANQRLDLPDLEIRFSIDSRRGDIVPYSVRLISKDRQADLLLPHEPTDLRFATQTYFRATTNLDHRILEFIDQSNLCVYDAQKHETPNRMTVGIPQQFLPRATSSEDSKDAELLINYSLVGIEHHHIIGTRAGQSDGPKAFSFSLSIIDAGPIGGRRQEVRIFDDRESKPVSELLRNDDHESKKPTTQSLYDSARDLIQKLHVQNQNPTKLFGRHSSPRLKVRVGNDSEIRLERDHVRRTMSDVPMGSSESERLSTPKPRHRLRRISARNYPGQGVPRKITQVFSRRLASKEQE